MKKTVVCATCNAKNVFEEGKRTHCSFCGMELSFVAMHEEESKAAKTPKDEAVSFNNSLTLEINGMRQNLTTLWSTLYDSSKGNVQKLIAFYNQYSQKIEFALELFETLSEGALYEIGEFNRTQMISIINFRNAHGLLYLDAINNARAHIKKLQYEKSALGLFSFAAKKVIKRKIERTLASIAVLEYEYASTRMEIIVKKYSAMIEPLKQELSGVAKTAFKRRGELNEKIKLLETQKEAEILKLDLKNKTVRFKKAVKATGIKYEKIFNLEAVELSAPTVEKPNYEEMEVPALISLMEEVVDRLESSVTGGDTETCKDLYKVLYKKAPGLFTATYQQVFDPGAIVGRAMPLTDEMMKGIAGNVKSMINMNKGKFVK